MAQLVLLVVAAAWAAVLIPPMLRSRVDNHPDSSVTDFRRQLSKLQSTATPARGGVRAMGRPLAPSGVQRTSTARTGGPAHHRHASYRQASMRAHAPASYVAAPNGYRTHGDPSGGVRRPDPRSEHRPEHRSSHVRQAPVPVDPRGAVKRRRTNVLFLLIAVTACTLFLATTTQSTVMLYVFALAFLALCGYVYLLAQIRQREHAGWNDAWFD
jgi:hypothetical protein